MLTKNARIIIGTALAVALIAVLLISTTGNNNGSGHSMSGMDHSTMTTGHSSTPTSAPSDVDAAFVRQMIPHHQLAVEMAKIARQNARHGQIKTLAAAIISAQNKEIAQLREIAKASGVDLQQTSGMMNGDAKALGLSMDEMGMSMDMQGFAEADPFDRAFIDGMIPHHKGAIAMANAELKNGSNGELKAIARAIIAAQNKEITQMKRWRSDWYGDDAATSSSSTSSMDDMPGM